MKKGDSNIMQFYILIIFVQLGPTKITDFPSHEAKYQDFQLAQAATYLPAFKV